MVEKEKYLEIRETIAEAFMTEWGFPLEFKEEEYREKIAGKYDEKWKEDFYVNKKRKKFNLAFKSAYRLAEISIKIIQESEKK